MESLAQVACPLSGVKRTLTNRYLPNSIYECRPQSREDAAASSALARSSPIVWRASTMRRRIPHLEVPGCPQNCNQRAAVIRAVDRDQPGRFKRFKRFILRMPRYSPKLALLVSQLEGKSAAHFRFPQIQQDAVDLGPAHTRIAGLEVKR